MRSFYRLLRIISAVTLFFFAWSFLPLWQAVAYAATSQGQVASSKGAGKQGPGTKVQGSERPEDRFEKALDEIRENVGKARDKEDRSEDDTRERETIKAKRMEIESADGEFKKDFASTEKKLKDAKLPKEILDRHYKFVKNYENNLKELKTNLDDIEQAKTGSDRKAKIEKARLHLEKIKKPSTHQKLDPNNLPFKARHATKTREPRLKKEEFEKEFPSQKSRGKGQVASSKGSEPWGQGVVAADFSLREKAKQKPILVASNGSLAGLLSTDKQLPLLSGDTVGSAPEWFSRGVSGGLIPNSAFAIQNWDILNSAPSTLNLAALTTTDAPTAADLAETPEVQFTDDIKALAAQLEYKPVKIYEWVRNNIEFVPTYGSIQGAQMTLETKMGNAFDTASLLIALLRASGISARYGYGTIEIPIENAMNWVGGVTDPKMAGTILSTNGIPAKMLISGGTYKAVQLEHVYVKAFIDYIPSRGAVHKQGDTWIPLDPSYKQYTYTQGIDISAAVPFDAQAFADQLVSTATISETGGYVTNVNAALVQQTMQDYQTQVQNYITQNNPNATVGDVLGKKEIIKREFPLLLGTLPYKTVQVGAEFSEVPSTYRATMSFSIPDVYGDTGLSYSTTLPQIAGKKITLSYSPATVTDQKTIESYLPKAHADGSAINPSELPASFPAYLIVLKPELRIDGQVVISGSAVTMGSAQSFTMSLNEPNIGVSKIVNIIKAGEYFGIGVDTGRIGVERLNALKTKLETTMAKFDALNYDGLTKDDLVGDLLYTTIASYFGALDLSGEVTAKTMNLVRYRVTSIGMFSCTMNVKEVFGVPTSAGAQGLLMDVDRIMQTVFSKDGNMEKVRQYMHSTGDASSALEHLVPEQLYSTSSETVKGISAVKALQIANDQGIPIYTISKSNINVILPQLQVSEEVKSDILNAVNAGKEVSVSKTNISYNNWIGCGYIISDPITGAGAYMISGGQNGAVILLLLGLALLAIGAAMVATGALILGVLVMALTPIFLAFLFWLAYQASPTFLNNFTLVFGIASAIALTFVSPVLGLIVGLYMAIAALLASWQTSFFDIKRFYHEYYNYA